MTKSSNTSDGRYAMPNKVYDVLKEIAQLYLPATGALYAALAAIWGWGFIVEVTGTVLALGTFLGAVLKLSTISYNNSDKSKDGDLNLAISSSGVTTSSVYLDTPASELINKDRAVLDVHQEDSGAKMDQRLLNDSQE